VRKERKHQRGERPGRMEEKSAISGRGRTGSVEKESRPGFPSEKYKRLTCPGTQKPIIGAACVGGGKELYGPAPVYSGNGENKKDRAGPSRGGGEEAVGERGDEVDQLRAFAKERDTGKRTKRGGTRQIIKEEKPSCFYQGRGKSNQRVPDPLELGRSGDREDGVPKKGPRGQGGGSCGTTLSSLRHHRREKGTGQMLKS